MYSFILELYTRNVIAYVSGRRNDLREPHPMLLSVLNGSNFLL